MCTSKNRLLGFILLIWISAFSSAHGIPTSTRGVIVTFEDGIVATPTIHNGTVVIRTSSGELPIPELSNATLIDSIVPKGWKAYSIRGPYICITETTAGIEAYADNAESSPYIQYAEVSGTESEPVCGEDSFQWLPGTEAKPRFCDQWEFHRRLEGEPSYPSECSVTSTVEFGEHDMDMPQAWGISLGNEDVLVGVIDIGFAWWLPELGGNGPATTVSHADSIYSYTDGVIYSNYRDAQGDANEDGRPGVALVDDDGDGIFDEDSKGYDYRNLAEPDVWQSTVSTVVGDTIYDSQASFGPGSLVGYRFYGFEGNTKKPWASVISNTATAFVVEAFGGQTWESRLAPGAIYRVGDGNDNDPTDIDGGIWEDDDTDDLGWDNDLAWDDDESGIKDDFHGVDFVGAFGAPTVVSPYPNEDYDTVDNDVFSHAGHGSWVAALTASSAGHGDMLGAAPRVKLLLVRAGFAHLHSSGTPQPLGLPAEIYIRSIAYCREMGVDVLVSAINLANASFNSAQVRDALQGAINDGIVFANGAGNGWYDSQPILAALSPRLFVSGLNNDDAAYRDSQYPWIGTAHGPWVDIAAAYWALIPNVPGSPDQLTGTHLDYTTTTGTSLSGPMVGGVAALVKSVYPHYGAADIVNKMKSSVDDIYRAGQNAGLVGQLGTGRVNAYRALTFYGNIPAQDDTTWAHNIWIGGDIHVPQGRTLTIAAGDTVRVAVDDLLSGGADPDEIEFKVDGSLHFMGSRSAPVVFERFDESQQRWRNCKNVTCTGTTFSLDDLNFAAIASAAEYPLVPGVGAASQVLAIRVSGTAALDSVTVDLSGLGIAGQEIRLRDTGAGEDLVAGDRIFTSAPFAATLSPGAYSVDANAFAASGWYLAAPVAVEVPELVAKFADVSSQTGLNFSGNPCGAVSGRVDASHDKGLAITSSNDVSTANYLNSISGAGVPTFGYAGPRFEVTGVRGATRADYDNDGDEDVFLAHDTTPKLYRNDSGNFVDVTSAMGLATSAGGSASACWGDYDNDGWLDLFVTRCATPAVEPPDKDDIGYAPHRLFRNTCGSGGGFVDVTAAAGMIVTYMPIGTAAAWGDLENDGDLDLLSLDLGMPGIGRSALFVNQGNGTFNEEILSRFGGGTVGSGDIYYGTGIVWSDMNNDGYLDVVMSWACPGSCVAFNDGSGVFSQRSTIPSSSDGYGGVQVLDHNLDGWQDVFMLSRSEGKPSRLFLAKPTFDGVEYVENTHNAGLAHSSKGMGSLAADYTADGDMELFVGRPVASGQFFYKTDSQAGSNSLGKRYVKVRLESPTSNGVNRQGIGAAVTITAGSLVQTQLVDGGSGRGGQRDRILTFGLDDYSGPVTATVRWPGGTQQSEVDLIASGAGASETVNVISDVQPVVSNVSVASYVVPGISFFDWEFSWDTDVACKTANDVVNFDQVGIENPCWPGWTAVYATSSGIIYSYTAKTGGGYTHKIRINHEACNLFCSFRYTVTSDAGLMEATSAPKSKMVKFCPAEF